jgi:murein hydrolase activator
MKTLSVIFLLLLLYQVLVAQSRQELENQKEKAVKEIELARELINKTAKEKSVSLQQLGILQKGISSRNALLEALEKEVRIMDGEIGKVERRISELNRENEKNEYARIIYFAFRNHTNYEKLMYILAGENISQSYQRYKYLKYISDYRVKKSEEIVTLVEELDLQKTELDGLKQEKLILMENKEEETEQLVKQRQQRAALIEQLNKQETRLKKEIAEKERVARELENKIREVIEEETRRLNAENITGALSAEQMLVGSSFKQNKGRLPWPVERHIVTMGFGNSEFPGLRGSNINNSGIDINSLPGTQVKAVYDGEVTKVFPILGANYTVLIRHGEYLSVYQNLVNVRVKGGDKIKTGQVIGDAFTDEKNNVSQMHFQVWHEKSVLNPEDWLRK